MKIERKSVPASTVIESEARLTIPEIPGHAAKVIPALLAEAEGRGMAVTGPCIFTYEGCNGCLETVFTLKVSIPVDACRSDGLFACLEVPAHECLCTGYKGPMKGIGEVWSSFTPLALQSDVTLQPVGREVYLDWVDEESPDNLVELQIPLKG